MCVPAAIQPHAAAATGLLSAVQAHRHLLSNQGEGARNSIGQAIWLNNQNVKFFLLLDLIKL